ncbi:hypothetical protein Rhe02_92560 [Rhizocola hellebori]|uniref:Aerobactin siderophore biosynthesis IucA/IucC-like C-terminal domain-containing protein n=1 Tax=Rhizocola hellebori TaxID=1392758 RepID=A0A8J3QHF1_9ACTN|nr:IucA/IucC family C-terminal-domain containing protein [Rhizocola hellebori]GIH11189.1 hypothetical protein Rhe02_92560 [Rhizocola hellebori]
MSTTAFTNTPDALRPLAVTLSALGSTQGLADPLNVVDQSGWLHANDLLNGSRLPDLFEVARRRWGAAPHAAATLAWKSYTYWLALPAVLSWAVARRIPHIEADNVLVRFSNRSPLIQIGLASPAMVVLPDDPLAQSGLPGISVAADEDVLLKTLRVGLLDRHLDPLSERIRAEVKVGRRTLLGSVASGIAYAVVRARNVLPEPAAPTVDTLLQALDLDDLVEVTPGPGSEPAVRRKTCCLAFTLPQPKICSGCCLRSA